MKFVRRRGIDSDIIIAHETKRSNYQSANYVDLYCFCCVQVLGFSSTGAALKLYISAACYAHGRLTGGAGRGASFIRWVE